MRAIASLGFQEAIRTIASSIWPHDPPPPPAGSHTDIMCRNCRRNNNCLNLRQRRRENNVNDPT